MRLRLGTRRSPLALAQSTLVARKLEGLHSDLEVELVPIITRGDTTPGSLAALGGKGLFTEELEKRLLQGSIDLAVHSLKDLPVMLPSGLLIGAYPERADPRDVLVSERADSTEGLAPGARVLTGSLRRRAQLLAQRPDLQVEDIRGNVDTRLQKWRESGADGLILAAAGLARLGLGAPDVPAHPLPPEVMVPSPGQGTLAIEVANGSKAHELSGLLNHPPTARASEAERRVVESFGGDCALPLGAWGRCDGEAATMSLTVFLAAVDSERWVSATVSATGPSDTADLAVYELRQQGAHDLLKRHGP